LWWRNYYYKGIVWELECPVSLTDGRGENVVPPLSMSETAFFSGNVFAFCIESMAGTLKNDPENSRVEKKKRKGHQRCPK